MLQPRVVVLSVSKGPSEVERAHSSTNFALLGQTCQTIAASAHQSRLYITLHTSACSAASIRMFLAWH